MTDGIFRRVIYYLTTKVNDFSSSKNMFLNHVYLAKTIVMFFLWPINVKYIMCIPLYWLSLFVVYILCYIFYT